MLAFQGLHSSLLFLHVSVQCCLTTFELLVAAFQQLLFLILFCLFIKFSVEVKLSWGAETLECIVGRESQERVVFFWLYFLCSKGIFLAFPDELSLSFFLFFFCFFAFQFLISSFDEYIKFDFPVDDISSGIDIVFVIEDIFDDESELFLIGVGIFIHLFHHFCVEKGLEVLGHVVAVVQVVYLLCYQLLFKLCEFWKLELFSELFDSQKKCTSKRSSVLQSLSWE